MLRLVRLCVRSAVGPQVERGETRSSARDGGLCDYAARRCHRRHLSRGCQHGELLDLRDNHFRVLRLQHSRAPTIQTLVIHIALENKYVSKILIDQINDLSYNNMQGVPNHQIGA